MPIEKGMMGMMKLITKLGGYTVTAAKTAGRINAAAFSPVTAFNFVPKPNFDGGNEGTTFVDAIGNHNMIHVVMSRLNSYHNNSSFGGKSGPVPSRSTRTQRPRRVGSKSSHRPRRRPSSGRRRKRCAHRDKRGRQCLRPAGHSGRHRYQ